MYNNCFADNDEYKVKIDSYRPLDKDAVKQIQEYYRIGLTYSSNALEGNSLDLADTKIVLEDGLTISGKPMKDHLETIGLPSFRAFGRKGWRKSIGKSVNFSKT